MTEKKSHRLYLEIMGIFALCFLLSFVMYFFLSFYTIAVIEEYCFYKGILLTDDQFYRLDITVFASALVISVLFFAIMFFLLFGKQLAYIRAIISGVEALREGDFESSVPLMGKNELTDLARSVNYLSESEREIKEKERKLSEEREELVRTLSHDIRTPLTSLMSYTELLSVKKSISQQELVQYFELVGKKTSQIKYLTDILLDSGKRQLEELEDAGILFLQLADEFEEMLEADFDITLDTSGLPRFRGRFDVQEMRRIFDNLISNVQKYADTEKPVTLRITLSDDGLVIIQKNSPKLFSSRTDGYRTGILSMRRIAQNYRGNVYSSLTEEAFEITVTLSDIC